LLFFAPLLLPQIVRRHNQVNGNGRPNIGFDQSTSCRQNIHQRIGLSHTSTVWLWRYTDCNTAGTIMDSGEDSGAYSRATIAATTVDTTIHATSAAGSGS
jgi:hypothetical protein